MTISERFSRIRDHFSLSAARLAEIAGVTGSAIAKIESGETANPKADVLSRISRQLQINLNWLVLGEGDMLKRESSPEVPQRGREPGGRKEPAHPLSEMRIMVMRKAEDGSQQPDLLLPDELLRLIEDATHLLGRVERLEQQIH